MPQPKAHPRRVTWTPPPIPAVVPGPSSCARPAGFDLSGGILALLHQAGVADLEGIDREIRRREGELEQLRRVRVAVAARVGVLAQGAGRAEPAAPAGDRITSRRRAAAKLLAGRHTPTPRSQIVAACGLTADEAERVLDCDWFAACGAGYALTDLGRAALLLTK